MSCKRFFIFFISFQILHYLVFSSFVNLNFECFLSSGFFFCQFSCSCFSSFQLVYFINSISFFLNSSRVLVLSHCFFQLRIGQKIHTSKGNRESIIRVGVENQTTQFFITLLSKNTKRKTMWNPQKGTIKHRTIRQNALKWGFRYPLVPFCTILVAQCNGKKFRIFKQYIKYTFL